jgi:hypothetical protein
MSPSPTFSLLPYSGNETCKRPGTSHNEGEQGKRQQLACVHGIQDSYPELIVLLDRGDHGVVHLLEQELAVATSDEPFQHQVSYRWFVLFVGVHGTDRGAGREEFDNRQVLLRALLLPVVEQQLHTSTPRLSPPS